MEFFKVTIAATVYVNVEVSVLDGKLAVVGVEGTNSDGHAVALEPSTVDLKSEQNYIIDALAEEYDVDGEF